MIFNAVHSAFEQGKIATHDMESDYVTFAGFGEPLLRIDSAVVFDNDRHHHAKRRFGDNMRGGRTY